MGWRKKETPTPYSGSKVPGSVRPTPGCSHRRNEAVSRRTLHDRVIALLRCTDCGYEWEVFET